MGLLVAVVPDTFAAHDAYLETQVLTASPIQLRLMLIEGAQRFARLGREAYTEGRRQEGQIYIGRCQQVLVELLGSLQPKGNAVSQSIVGLYAFLVRSVSEVILLEQPEQLDEICRVLAEEQTTWRMLVERDNVAPTTEVSQRAPEAAALTAPVERFDLNM
jgi:flagellar protein FliS